LWDVAYEVVLHELARGGRDGNPVLEAGKLVDAMRSAGKLYGVGTGQYVDGVEQSACAPNWARLACLAAWYSTETAQNRADALGQIRAGTTPWGNPSVQPPTLHCPPGQTTWCCPAPVYTDPLYNANVQALYRMARHDAPPPKAPLATWLLAIAALGSFGLGLLAFLGRNKG
jgi:hypothetical protein